MNARLLDEAAVRLEICRFGRSFFDRGYVRATAGNISVRLADGFLITQTDACLGSLDPDRLARLDADPRLRPCQQDDHAAPAHLPLARPGGSARVQRFVLPSTLRTTTCVAGPSATAHDATHRRLFFSHALLERARFEMAPHDSHHHGAAMKSHVELRFLPRFGGQRRLVFPCNAAGHVEIDKLSEHERVDYLFARAHRGRDYSLAIVTALDA